MTLVKMPYRRFAVMNTEIDPLIYSKSSFVTEGSEALKFYFTIVLLS